jgi:hypothetical protein
MGRLGGASGPLLSNGASYQGIKTGGGSSRPEAPVNYGMEGRFLRALETNPLNSAS